MPKLHHKFTTLDALALAVALESIEQSWVDQVEAEYLSLNTRHKGKLKTFLQWLKHNNITFNVRDSRDLWVEFEDHLESGLFPLPEKQGMAKFERNHMLGKSKYMVSVRFKK